MTAQSRTLRLSVLGLMLSCLLIAQTAAQGAARGKALVHRAAAGNVSGNSTFIDDPFINNDPNAILFVTPNWNPPGSAGVYNDRPVGVWYEAGRRRWAIFNQDMAAMRAGAAFNVLALRPADGSNAFVHRAASGNVSRNFTYIDHPLTNGRPDAALLVTSNFNPGGRGGVYNSHPLGVSYDEARQRWAVFNQDLADMPVGAAFNVAVGGASVARATGSNISGNTFGLDITGADVNSVVLVTANYNPGGRGGTYHNRSTGVYHTGTRWAVFNQDMSAMPVGAAFNVRVLRPGEVTTVISDLMTPGTRLPGDIVATNPGAAPHVSTPVINPALIPGLIARPGHNGPPGFWDFESGNLQGWTRTGTAFDAQPTYGNNVEVRRPGTAANHQGNYWVGTYENRPSASAPHGAIQGDGPQGTLSSPRFTIETPYIRFRVGGGSILRNVRVQLRTDEPDTPLIFEAAGNDDETMRWVTWDVRAYHGTEVYVRIVDGASGHWGHINVDDFQFTSDAPGPEVLRSWDFENTEMVGREWVKTGDAFYRQPTFGENVGASRISPRLVPLGGDYWQGPYPTGIQGRYWIGTYEARVTPAEGWGATQGDGPTGTMTSTEFVINKPYIDFLIGGGASPHERIELQVEAANDAQVAELGRLSPSGLPRIDGGLIRDGYFVTVLYASGRDSELMRRMWWDVRALAGRVARIRIVDGASGHWGHINVDDIRFRDAPAAESPPVWGFADTHAHPAAHLGFGGLLYAGQGHGPLESALQSCERSHGIGGTGLQNVGSVLSALGGVVGPVNHETVAELAVNAVEGTAGHMTHGWPEFDGWPRYTTKLHQHMHEDWIRRAYDGGLRLMVAHAVNAEILAHLKPAEGHPVSDKAVYDLQIQAIKEMAARNRAWMAVAYTPREAREIIGQNKLALILGIEVDSLGDWQTEAEATAPNVGAELERLYGLGVRHIFPIHLANNPFGGCSVYSDIFNFNNRVLRDEFHRVRPGDDARRTDPRGNGFGYDIQYRLMETFPAPSDSIWNDLRNLLDSKGLNTLRLPRRTLDLRGMLDDTLRAKGAYDALDGGRADLPGHRNSFGLTPAGRGAITKMMELGMVIEVDHMSELSADEAMDMAERRDANGLRGYPLTSGHTTFRELKRRRGETGDNHKYAHEADKTPAQLERLRQLGGMVAPMTTGFDVRQWGARVPNDAPGSVKSFAQAYLYAVERMGGRGVALSTDMALLGGMGPRFGAWGAHATDEDEVMARRQGFDSARALRRYQLGAQFRGVRYSTPLRTVRAYRFDGSAYNGEEQDIWLGVMLGRSDVDIDTASLGGAFLGLRWRGNDMWIKDVAKGVRAAVRGQPLESLPVPNGILTSNAWGLYNFAEVQRGAWHAYMGSDSYLVPGRPLEIQDPAIRAVADKLRAIALTARGMDGPNPPLTRCAVGLHDCDFNLDGFSHYGMLPDLLQDAKNVGLSHDDLVPLFRSAEDYLRMWERCERMRTAR